METIRILFGHPAFLILTALAVPVLIFLLIARMMKTESLKKYASSKTESMSSKNLVKFLPIGIIVLLLLLFLILNLDKKHLFSPFTPERLERKTIVMIFLLPVVPWLLSRVGTLLIYIFLPENDKRANTIKVVGEILERISLFLLIAIFIFSVILMISLAF